MDKQVRQEVFERARGKCECRCGRTIDEETGRLDHFFGRAKAEESVANCWALHLECDETKTLNRPSAAHWLKSFVKHLCRHVDSWDDSYFSALDKAMAKLASLQVKGLAR